MESPGGMSLGKMFRCCTRSRGTRDAAVISSYVIAFVYFRLLSIWYRLLCFFLFDFLFSKMFYFQTWDLIGQQVWCLVMALDMDNRWINVFKNQSILFDGRNWLHRIESGCIRMLLGNNRQRLIKWSSISIEQSINQQITDRLDAGSMTGNGFELNAISGW